VAATERPDDIGTARQANREHHKPATARPRHLPGERTGFYRHGDGSKTDNDLFRQQ
jgi:hypothetical protein